MSNLRDTLIKIGTHNKSLRPHLRPILAAIEKGRDKGAGGDSQLIQNLKRMRKDTAAALVNAHPSVERVITRGVKGVTYEGKDAGDDVYTFQLLVKGDRGQKATLQLKFYADVHGLVHGEAETSLEGRKVADEVFMMMGGLSDMHSATRSVVKEALG